MPIRKIAYLTPLYFDEASCLGGGERYPANLAAGVVEASGGEVSVDILSYGPRSLTRPLGPGVSLRVLTAANRPRNPLDVVSWELPAAIADADLVHVHMIYTRSNEMGVLVAKQQRKPVVMTDHGGTSSTIGLDLGVLELADRIIAYSDFGAALYQTRRPVVVIKGGVDGAAFTPPPSGTPRVRDRVLYVGRLLPHKGIDTLIEALPPELPLTVCGRPYHEAYFARLKALAAGKKVEFVTDATDETILNLYRRAWANVLPSVYRDCYGKTHVAPELMGFTLLEAMACGTPAICSRVAAMPEFVDDGVTGFVFDTPDDLAARLRRLAGDPALVEEMGRRARRAVDDEFDLRVAGRRFLDVYRDAVRHARGLAA
ncbi:MAG: glycosyltransferase family 4 protein [Isosphaeraceae bacterium]